MNSFDLQEIGEVALSAESYEVLKSEKGWTLWIENPQTKKFFDYLMARRFEIQNELMDMDLSQDEQIARANQLKGGYFELVGILKDLNQITGRSDFTEST